MNMDTQNFTEDPAEHIRQRADATLTRRLQDPQRLSPGSLVGVLFPVIEKYLAAGLKLEDIAAALQEDGFAVKKTHLVRHLGSLRAERGSRTPPAPAAIPAATQPTPIAPTPAATESVATVGAKKRAGSVPAPVAPAPVPAPAEPRAEAALDPAPADPAPAVPAVPTAPAAAVAPAPAATEGAKKELPAAPALAVPRAEAASAPAPLPEIPAGDLTDAQRSEIVKKWIAAQFGDRHPGQIKPEELSAEALAWLERLWGVSAPINAQTGKPYRFMRLTFAGRPMYDNPILPPGAVPIEGGSPGFVVLDDRAREAIAKYSLRLVAHEKFKNSLNIVDKYGRRQVGGILQSDARTIERCVADIESAIEEAKARGEQY